MLSYFYSVEERASLRASLSLQRTTRTVAVRPADDMLGMTVPGYRTCLLLHALSAPSTSALFTGSVLVLGRRHRRVCVGGVFGSTEHYHYNTDSHSALINPLLALSPFSSCVDT